MIGIETVEGADERSIERFAPGAEFGDRHEVRVRAPARVVLEVAENFDLMSISAIYAIFWLRARLLGASPPSRDDLRGLVSQTKRMGWGELARRPGREVVMGAAVQPWLPEPVFKPIPPERFAAYSEPEHVRIVWTLEAEPLGPNRSLLRTETRVMPTDEVARKRFRRYWRLARFGIVLIRLFTLPAMRRQAEERWREYRVPGDGFSGPGALGSGSTALSEPSPPLLHEFLPDFETTVVREILVDAPPDITFGAIADTNLVDPIVRLLFTLRELPSRLLAGVRGGPRPHTRRSTTLHDLLAPGTGMVRLAENPGVEIVVGSVGRFWERDYGHREVAPEEFADLREPGQAKLAMDFWVQPDGHGKSVLRYEARTATTDEEAHRRFRRYWRLIRPGVRLVMGRAVALIRREAERRADASGRAIP